MKYVLTALLILVFTSSAFAQEKKPQTCQEQLNEVTVQAYNLDAARDSKEREVAALQVTIYGLKQDLAKFEKALADLKKPKVEEKKAE